MKKVMLLPLLCSCLNSSAQSAIFLDCGECFRINPKTEQVTICVKMHNEEQCNRWIVNAIYPEGFKPISVEPLSGMVLNFEDIASHKVPLCSSQDLTAFCGFVGIQQYWDENNGVVVNDIFKWEVGDFDLFNITFQVSDDFRRGTISMNGIIDCGTDNYFFSTTNLYVGYDIGDVNGDGNITISDATLIIDYLLGCELNEFQKDAADVNVDGEITISDVSNLIDIKLLNNERQ